MKSLKRRAVKSKRVSAIERGPQAKHRLPPDRAPRPEALRLDSRLTITRAADLHGALLARLADGGPIVLDGTRVEEIDTAILQLLASLWRTALERDTPCVWRGASDALRHTATLIGVAEALHFADGDSVQGRDHAAA